jgi:hypothetical protein
MEHSVAATAPSKFNPIGYNTAPAGPLLSRAAREITIRVNLEACVCIKKLKKSGVT